MTINRVFAFANSVFSRWNVFDNGDLIGYDDRLISPDPVVTMRVVRTIAKTGIGIGLGGGSIDVPVVWRNAQQVATPFPDDKYTIIIADTLPAGVAANVLAQTASGCTIRVSASLLVAIGLPIDLTAYTP